MKHKVLKDFQLLIDKKILILKTGTTLVDYKYITKMDTISVEKDVVDQNPDFFTIIDWKSELILYIKQNKLPQPSILSKKLIPFIEETFILNSKSDSSELESKIRKYDELETKLKDKEDKLRDLEISLNKRERSMDKSIIDSEMNMDVKQSEMNTRLDNKLKDIEKRESELEKYKSDIKDSVIEFVKPIYPTLHDWGRNNYEKLLKKLE